MADSSRTRTPSASIEARLLDAAEEILESEGPDALSVRRIASLAGVAPMGVYNHFDSKSGIVDALFKRGFARLHEALSTLSAIDDPFEALAEGGRRYRRLALDHPRSYQLMFLRAVPGYVPSFESAKVANDAFAGLVAAVERAQRTGALLEEDATLVAQMLWSTSHGWVSLQICGLGFVEDVEGGATKLEMTLMAGLLRAGGPPMANDRS